MAAIEKLVRDKLGARIPAAELRVETSREALGKLLEAKLAEEVAELRDSGYRDPGEFGDVLEVLYALAARAGLSAADLEAARKAKLSDRGGFDRGLVWTGGSPVGSPARPAAIPAPPPGEAHVYADGACSGNPGPGGWGAVLVAPDGRLTELGGGDPATTNNRMELAAATAGLDAALASGHGRVVMYLDSQYVMDGITKWIHGWKRRGWKTADGAPVKNQDQWQALDAAQQRARAKSVAVAWEWVKGHAGNPGNEHADALARRNMPRRR